MSRPAASLGKQTQYKTAVLWSTRLLRWRGQIYTVTVVPACRSSLNPDQSVFVPYLNQTLTAALTRHLKHEYNMTSFNDWIDAI